MMTRRTSLLALLILAASGSVTAADKSGFGGKWVLDSSASNMASPMPDNVIQEIKDSNGKLQVRTTWREPKNGMLPVAYLGLLTSEYRLQADGTEVPNQVGPWMMNTKTTMSGKSLTTDWSANNQGKVMNGQWVRTLSDDGRTMTLQVNSTGADGNPAKSSLVFKRK